MKKIILISILFVQIQFLFAQEGSNASELLITNQTDSKVQIGGYAQIDFNNPVEKDKLRNSTLDIHRMVLLFGYRFNDRTNFITEIELEHVSEIYVEQAFLNYEILPWLNFRGGLMLIPMGIVNEYHEPPSFNGVERPNLDSKIVPSTWREIGAGFAGRIDNASLKYQLYIMNGFSGYTSKPMFRGSDGYRNGRQKGAESFMSSPNLAAKVEYYGFKGLKLGVSGYFGKSQSSLYNGLISENTAAVQRADSSVIGISMIGIDARYRNRGFEAKAQLNLANNKNTAQYNKFTRGDLGSQLFGWYAEVGYNVFQPLNKSQKLVPFLRYEKYNTHAKTPVTLVPNKAYNRTDITAGIGWWIDNGVVLKTDYQWFSNESNTSYGQFNMGIGIWF